ncbi:MAG TPA: hypothetical protein VFS39_07735 [Nitrospira sp.]|nr:hypothetical protein [Nitrospira sp.]
MAKKKQHTPNDMPSATRPVAKALIKAGLLVYDAAEKRLTDAGTRLVNFVSEIRSEMDEKPRSTRTASRREPRKK